jgi:hypothetical protein
VDLYKSTNGSYWSNNQNWLVGDACANLWAGVTCVQSNGVYSISQLYVDWIGLDWIGLDWIGLDWIGLDWIGLDWIGLDWIALMVDWLQGICS